MFDLALQQVITVFFMLMINLSNGERHHRGMSRDFNLIKITYFVKNISLKIFFIKSYLKWLPFEIMKIAYVNK
jgi:hypothetical protein